MLARLGGGQNYELNFQTLNLFVDEAVGTAQFEDADSPYSTTIALHSWDYGKSTQGAWTYLPWFGYYLETDTTNGFTTLITDGSTELVLVPVICGSMTTVDLGGYGQMLIIIPFSTLILSWIGFGLMKLLSTESFTTLILVFGGRTASLFKCLRYAL